LLQAHDVLPLEKSRRTYYGKVLRPGFEPGSTAREAVILDRTILPEQLMARGYSNVFNLIKIAERQKGKIGGCYSSPSGPPGIPPPGPPFGDFAVITSSMRSIMAADSAADFMACSLTATGSMMPLSRLFWVLPV
jgi:hypothetical protein